MYFVVPTLAYQNLDDIPLTFHLFSVTLPERNSRNGVFTLRWGRGSCGQTLMG